MVHKEGCAPKHWCFQIVVLKLWRRFLTVPWIAGKPNQSILKRINSKGNKVIGRTATEAPNLSSPSAPPRSTELISPPLQHTFLCPPSSPGVCSNSGPWVGDAIWPSHPPLPPFLLAFSLSQHQVAKIWEMKTTNLQQIHTRKRKSNSNTALKVFIKPQDKRKKEERKKKTSTRKNLK